jgi:hypothetical protein
MKLHHVTLPRDTEDERSHRESTRDAQAGARFVGSLVGPFVQDTSFRRETVLFPHLLQVDQAALPRAKKKMLERR